MALTTDDAATPSDKLGGKPWVAYVFALLAWFSVFSGVYLERLIGRLEGLDIGSLVAAAGFLTAGSVSYGFNAGRVKVKEIERTTTSEPVVEDA